MGALCCEAVDRIGAVNTGESAEDGGEILVLEADLLADGRACFFSSLRLIPGLMTGAGGNVS